MVNLHLTGEFWLTKKIKKSNIEKEIIQERIWNIRIISFFYTLWNSIGCSSAPPGACVMGYSGVYLMNSISCSPPDRACIAVCPAGIHCRKGMH